MSGISPAAVALASACSAPGPPVEVAGVVALPPEVLVAGVWVMWPEPQPVSASSAAVAATPTTRRVTAAVFNKLSELRLNTGCRAAGA